MAVPEGALLSDDGYYWWDGEQWQPVDQESSEPAAASVSSVSSVSSEDEDVTAHIEGSLDEEQDEISLDEMVAEGFEPEDAEEAMA